MAECFIDDTTVGIIMSHEEAALVCCLVGSVSGSGEVRSCTTTVFRSLSHVLRTVGIKVNSDLVKEIFGEEYRIPVATKTMPKLRKEE